MITVGCDPDTHFPAFAAVQDGVLIWAGAGLVPKELTGDRAVGAALAEIVGVTESMAGIGFFDRMVVEGQAIYPDTPLGKSGIDGLFRVAHTAGAAALALWCLSPKAQILMPQPFEWKGNGSKVKYSKRLKGGDIHLAGIEPRKLPHIEDAIGLALWGESHRGTVAVANRDLMQRARAEAKKINAARRRARS